MMTDSQRAAAHGRQPVVASLRAGAGAALLGWALADPPRAGQRLALAVMVERGRLVESTGTGPGQSLRGAAAELGVSWRTARRWLASWDTVRRALDPEALGADWHRPALRALAGGAPEPLAARLLAMIEELA